MRKQRNPVWTTLDRVGDQVTIRSRCGRREGSYTINDRKIAHRYLQDAIHGDVSEGYTVHVVLYVDGVPTEAATYLPDGSATIRDPRAVHLELPWVKDAGEDRWCIAAFPTYSPREVAAGWKNPPQGIFKSKEKAEAALAKYRAESGHAPFTKTEIIGPFKTDDDAKIARRNTVTNWRINARRHR